jgi:hypothetical protein
MAGRRSITWKLRQEALLAAVLTSPSLAQAAAAAGVSERTIRRAMKRPGFSLRVAEARKAAIACAITSLSGLADQAHDAVRRALVCGVPAVELRAALAVLLDGPIRGGEFLHGMAELAELREQIQALMQQQAEGVHRDQ